MLSERISTWRPIRSGRKNWQARQTASISKQLMWKPFSAFDQWPKVGLPSHSAPQPVLEASVVTTAAEKADQLSRSRSLGPAARRVNGE